jgi:hypothetical protein
MKEIELSNGGITQVDDEDYSFLSQFNWWSSKHKHCYYVETKRGGKIVRMHRLIMGVTDKKDFIDHIDHNGLNNQKKNLRVCTNSENVRNKRKHMGASKYMGVALHNVVSRHGKHYSCWKVRITHNKKVMFLGLFKNEIEAAKAYDRAAIMYHGEFANLNFKAK